MFFVHLPQYIYHTISYTIIQWVCVPHFLNLRPPPLSNTIFEDPLNIHVYNIYYLLTETNVLILIDRCINMQLMLIYMDNIYIYILIDYHYSNILYIL